MSLPSKISFWRAVFDQGAVTQPVIDHRYPGSGTEDDPFVITWIPDDPRNPQLSPAPRKWAITVLVSLAALAVSLISSAYSGGLNEILEYFDISEEVAYVGISLYVLGFAVGPVFWAPLSELYGRRPIYIVSMSSLTIFTASVAGAKNTQTLLILRFLAGSLGSAPMAIPGGVVADLFDPVVRGLAAMLYAAAPFLGPVLGPVVGGFIAESGGWRWVQGALALFSGVLTILVVFLFPETYAPVLLRQRATRLQKITGHVYRSVSDGAKQPLHTKLGIALSRPWTLLFHEPIVFLLCTYVAVVYGILYMLFAAYPIVFQEVRGWSEGSGGLSFLGILVGIACAIAYAFPVYFRYKRKSALARARGLLRLPPEERLPDSFPAAVALPVGLFWFAWTNAPTIHPLVPIAAGVPFGFGMVMVFLPVFNYLIDTYTLYAASALAANTMLRSLFGAVFPLFTGYMFRDLGIHWASCVPAFLSLACAPLPFVFYFSGERIRKRSRFAREAEAYLQRVLGKDHTGPIKKERKDEEKGKTGLTARQV
ncbi:major facilitator superfamily domain-containing protein [Aspergillus pseudoustus]|uniref:Major facilitator superfamily domain-containing protein n=1 Tax=Aspergillus pseudoustus TaxID=1810923 RepID=A0ABR4J0V7_9EURO